jgi:hypothetical protein
MEHPEKPPRTAVSLNDIQDKVKKTTYTLLPDGKTTVCQLHMENGYTINGHSACVDPANYNQALGEKYAYEDAINKAWPLEGYLLAEEIFRRGPQVKVYSWRDVATHSQLEDPMTGDTQFHVRMKDGAVFMGVCKEQFDTTPIEFRIVANVNKQLQDQVLA